MSSLIHNNFKTLVTISFYYELLGVILGSWVARIPEIKDAHQLSDGLFGLVLICAIGGGLLSFVFISTLVERYGSNRGAYYGSFALTILTPVIGIPIQVIWVLIIGITGLGFGWGIIDVAINTQVSLL